MARNLVIRKRKNEKVLKQIASKTIVFNLPATAEALKYLIQRISTTLWYFNAKMLMQRLAT